MKSHQNEPDASSSTVQAVQIDTNDSCIVQHSVELHTFEVSKDRLEQIKKSVSTGSDELALGTFLFSIGIAAISTLCTTNIKYEIMRYGYWVCTILGPSVGVYFLNKWRRSRNEGPTLIDEIFKSPEKGRKPL